MYRLSNKHHPNIKNEHVYFVISPTCITFAPNFTCGLIVQRIEYEFPKL